MKTPIIALEKATDYNNAKELLLCQAISRIGNEDYLSDKPHTRLTEDLDVFYRIDLSNLDESNGKGNDVKSCIVTNNLLRIWEAQGVTIEKLHEDAVHYQGSDLKPLSDVLMGLNPDFESNDAPMLYVATNRTRNVYGAGVLANEEFLLDIRNKVGGDFYILPSSIHEVLILTDMSSDPAELRQMVMGINENVVRPDEVLSNNVYLYNGKDIVVCGEEAA